MIFKYGDLGAMQIEKQCNTVTMADKKWFYQGKIFFYFHFSNDIFL